jgi:7,8-dihydropterin-6-yl-methyl-4-(beta-D-ribofuranosyl)aminobenzene 5'-phosphate synthase
VKVEETLSSVALTVVYDNLIYDEAFATSHGFACVVHAAGDEGTATLLFDTGGDFQTLAANVRQAKGTFSAFEAVVISHDHYDHAGGLEGVVREVPMIPVYLPDIDASQHVSSPAAVQKSIRVGAEPRRLAYGVWSSGVLENRMDEQGLVLLTSRGIVLVTGCAHPGVDRMAEHVKRYFERELYLVLGGFHRPPAAAIRKLHELGTRYVAPSHCTGEESTIALKKEFGEQFITSGAGRQFHIS